MTRLEIALDQIKTARRYTLNLLDDLEPGDWFRQPSEGVTHIAWQVGHLAMAQFRLALERLRGERPSDVALIGPDFLRRFAAGSTPDPNPAQYPAPAEIRQTLDRVFAQVLAEVPHYTDVDLEQPPFKPHPLFTTKIGSLFWCVRHEMLHAGQIGLVRRLLGKPPQW
jgi:uncharacterized damage-inducible protein DinB